MPIAALSDWAALIPLLLGVVGLAGLIFTALKYNRDDTTAVVAQQTQILDNMKTLNAELRTTADSLRTERDDLRRQVATLGGQVEALRDELRLANERLSGQVERIHDRLDG
jgi:uncharacterized coiled-coil DUF342 family protein